MPIVQPGGLVLISGASGFVAVHTIGAFLDAGFRVRGTVRSPAKGQYLKHLFRDKAGWFEYCIVEDISKPDAFDQAVKDVDGVAHMASLNVKRIVVTSSNAAITDPSRDASTGPIVFTEKDWNESSVATCNLRGREAPAMEKYRASKVLAEKAFWQFFKDHRPRFDGVALNPPMVFGPPIHECESAGQLNTSCKTFYEWQHGKKSKADLKLTGSWVDVGDCALAHVRALTVPEASMQRFIVSGGSYCGDGICLVLKALYPSAPAVMAGDPAAHELMLRSGFHIDGSKAKKVLGIEYNLFGKCFTDMATALESRYGM
ncbi:dihydrokaempferol 4-reductase [Pestalotiopsis sp. NC0098]|nr:dihydrokaempferol 4-reductase [Pestalotiopsis sp. NC0098]